MALKSKEGYLESLRRLEIAVTYELAHTADYKELFTTVSHLTGENYQSVYPYPAEPG